MDRVKGQISCFYWLPDRMECTLAKRGVYIPMSGHIENFCMTHNFANCCYYKKVHSTIEIEGLNVYRRHVFNRRCFCREVGRFCIYLKKGSGRHNSYHLRDVLARTIDISEGGMCIIVCDNKTKISLNSYYKFTFGDDFIIPNFSGICETKWGKEETYLKSCKLGLSFCGNKMKETLKDHLIKIQK